MQLSFMCHCKTLPFRDQAGVLKRSLGPPFETTARSATQLGVSAASYAPHTALRLNPRAFSPPRAVILDPRRERSPGGLKQWLLQGTLAWA